MFELGTSLREARVRRGLELAQVAAETRIRTRYLQALEEERFELLPGAVYAKGFLHAYADYLGLDGQAFLDEYNARFRTDEPLAAPAQLEPRPRSLPPYGLVAAVLLLALGGALLALQLGHSSSSPTRSHAAPGAAAKTPTSSNQRPAARPAGRGTVAGAALVLRATRGPCWLSVRLWNEHGRQLFEGMLDPGESRRFGKRRLWLRIGAPWNLVASRGGQRLSLPQGVATVLVTPDAVRTLALG
jgi:cytoskeleton protein RodZ